LNCLACAWGIRRRPLTGMRSDRGRRFLFAHDVAEAKTGTHESAEALAAETELPVSEGARRILHAMAGRDR
jgi:hypothetical protein